MQEIEKLVAAECVTSEQFRKQKRTLLNTCFFLEPWPQYVGFSGAAIADGMQSLLVMQAVRKV